jgi:hypothetical protein
MKTLQNDSSELMYLLLPSVGDEVVVIQGKLDGIKTRYAEINSMSGNVSKTLDQALTLASKLQHIHEDLSSWLVNVEAELTAFAAQEPVGEQLIQAQDRQKVMIGLFRLTLCWGKQLTLSY